MSRSGAYPAAVIANYKKRIYRMRGRFFFLNLFLKGVETVTRETETEHSALIAPIVHIRTIEQFTSFAVQHGNT